MLSKSLSCRLRRIWDPGAAVPIIYQLVILTILRVFGALRVQLISRTAILGGLGLHWGAWRSRPTRCCLPVRNSGTALSRPSRLSSFERFPFLITLLRLWELLNLWLFDLRLAYTPSASWKLFWRWRRPLRAAIVSVIRVSAVEDVCASKRRGFLYFVKVY